jgi:LmbE family N-acetylglucosaminyl deacetylase
VSSRLDRRSLEGRIRRLIAMVAPSTGDHLAIRDWTRIGDVDLAAKVLDTDAFTARVDAVEGDLSEMRSVVVVAPHPDDEVIGMGGTLQRLAAQGTAVHIVIVSGWEDRAETTTIRDEAQACADDLGASLTWLGVPNRTWICERSHLDRLAGLIGSIQPDALFVPWLLDTPPAHRLTNHILAAAVQRTPPRRPVPVWAYQVHNAILASTWVDITEQIDAKVELIRHYRSQIEGNRRYDHQAKGLAAWNTHFVHGRSFGYDPSRQPLYVELFFRSDLRAYCHLVDHWYTRDLRATYRNDDRYASAAAHLGTLV